MIMKGGAYVARAKRVPGVEERSENYPINATLLATGHTVNRIYSTYICWIIQQSELWSLFSVLPTMGMHKALTSVSGSSDQ